MDGSKAWSSWSSILTFITCWTVRLASFGCKRMSVKTVRESMPCPRKYRKPVRGRNWMRYRGVHGESWWIPMDTWISKPVLRPCWFLKLPREWHNLSAPLSIPCAGKGTWCAFASTRYNLSGLIWPMNIACWGVLHLRIHLQTHYLLASREKAMRFEMNKLLKISLEPPTNYLTLSSFFIEVWSSSTSSWIPAMILSSNTFSNNVNGLPWS